MKELTKKELQKLKAKSKNWKEQEWEEYLKTLEHERSESLIHPRRYEKLRNKNLFLTEGFEKKEEELVSLSQLKKALTRLTFKQKTVIKMIFFESLSTRQISERLGLSTSSVHERKTQALQKLKCEILSATPNTSPYRGAKVDFEALKSISKTHFSNTISEPFKKGESHVA